MNLLSKERLLTWVVPAALACVLVGLAVLQYRWSSEVSDAATTRIRAGLQNSMMNFRQDLSRDLGTLCLELQAEPGTSAAHAKRLAQNLEHWQRTTSVPGLISNVYFWRLSEDGERMLFRLVLPEARFQVIPWPPQLEHLQQVLSRVPLPASGPHSETSTGRHASKLRRDAGAPGIGGIDQSVPVLAIPATPGSGRNWLLVKLDLTVLQQRVFPQLAARYFGDATTSDYEVAVVATGGEEPQIIYSSDSGFLTNGQRNADSSLNLFGPPVSHGRPPQPPLDFFRSSGVRSVGTLGPPPGEPGGAFGPIRFDPIYSGGAEVDWRLVVRHRKGSVEAAVAGLRHRNLGLSFGVLLVLAASMALIIFNSHRAQRLAMLQMEFVAGVSHELRTPVAAILSISDNIASGIVNDKQKFIRYGDLIRNQARQLNHLIEQVLRFSATTQKASSYNIRPLQVSDVIGEALENTASLIASSEVEVYTKIEPNLPDVNADFNALSQCLQNLITNAVKYGGNSKWISVHAEVTRETGRNGEVKITVEDRGIGIDPEDLGHIFEAFYRSPKVAESEVHGTGLGLALANSFAEAMGGSITVESEIGKGSAFTVHLPVGKGSQFEQEPEVEQESSTTRL